MKIVCMALWLGVAGCGGVQAGGGRPATTPAREAPAATTQDTGGDPRAEIERLEREIRRQAAAVPPEPAEQEASTPAGQAAPASPPAPATDAAPGVSADGERTCEPACQAAGSICQAAQRICALASQMEDDWARGRCTAATRTCRETRRRTTNHCGPC